MLDTITPLHVRSGYSLPTGTQSAEALVRRAAAAGHARLALTDVNGLYGATVFWKLATEAQISPILGAELVADSTGSAADGFRVVALVTEETGYENLCRLITSIHRGNGGPNHQEAPCVSTGTVSSAATNPNTIPRLTTGACRDLDLPAHITELSQGLAFIADRPAAAEALLAAGVERPRLFVGLDPAVQARDEIRRLLACAEQLHLAPVAVAAALLGEAEDTETARLLAAIRLRETIDTVQPSQLPHPQAHLRSAEELRRQYAELPQAVANNRLLAERCAAFRLLPREPVFPRFACPDGLSPAAYLRQLAQAGARRRYGQITPAAAARLEKELALIERMGFCEYFLVVHDIVQYARTRGAPVAGRGSGASSLAAYVLGITNVCPLAWDIPFERFLNERRRDFPDLDVDFCWRLRDEVIDYAFRRWGGEHVAMVSMHATFQQRSALRETAKALGLSDDQITRMEAGKADTDADLPRIRRLAQRILDLPRHLSVHPGGIVIGRKPIDHYVPIQPAAKGVNITQLDKDGVEDLRLVKLDLLGNRNLSTVRAACELLGRRGVAIDVENLPPADGPTVELLRSADTVGCNQLESPAMRNLLRMMQPAGVGDVMKALALIRPGAASIGMKETFIRRHRGLEPVPTGHPAVDAVLGGTYGVMLCEDDVMLVAAAVMGGSKAEGDAFRKAVQQCRDDHERLELSRRFLDRCRQARVDVDYAKGLWVQMAKFNAYSFCRAHAASYAALAYAGAYLRRHWALEFFAAALNNNQSMYHPRVYVESAKRAGVVFLPPDVNRSAAELTVEGQAIRVGLDRVGGLGPATVRTILEARARRPFVALGDFLTRTHLGHEETRALVLCGAFDWTGRKRPTLMMELNLFGPMSRAASREETHLLAAGPIIPDPPGDYTALRKYLDERKILGFSTGQHLLAMCRPHLVGATDADSRDLPHRLGQRVTIAGLPEAMRTTRTRNDKTIVFLTMEDEFGLFEVTVFPDAAGRPSTGRPVRQAGSGRPVLDPECSDRREHVEGRCRLPSRYAPTLVTAIVEQQYDAITLRATHIVQRQVLLERLAS